MQLNLEIFYCDMHNILLKYLTSISPQILMDKRPVTYFKKRSEQVMYFNWFLLTQKLLLTFFHWFQLLKFTPLVNVWICVPTRFFHEISTDSLSTFCEEFMFKICAITTSSPSFQHFMNICYLIFLLSPNFKIIFKFRACSRNLWLCC